MEREAVNRLILAAEYMMDGRSISWVAREFGYSALQARYLAALLGVQGKRGSPGPDSLDKYDQVEQAILQGWPIGEIEKTFKVPRSTINKWFPDRPKMSPEEAGELGQLYLENIQVREKARERGSWAELVRFDREE